MIKTVPTFIKRNAVRVFMICIGIWALLTTAMRNPNYMEIDSYVLPIVSIQHRGSIIMQQQDIDQAKIDFPDLYFGVNNYDTLRLSRLRKIDDNHWVSFYFPVYAIVCLPVKLILTFFRLNQQQAFTLTNAVFLLFSLYFVIRNYRKNKNEGLICAILLCCCPILYYIQYIGAEPIMFSMAIVAYILWEKKQYKTAALIISITSMTNPTFLGIGIIMFFEYIYSRMKDNKLFIKQKQELKNMFLLCLCYVPFIIPFIFNMVTLHTLNPTMPNMPKMGMLLPASGDTVWKRFLAYIFDWNLGVPSISVVMLILFFAGIVYSIVKKEKFMVFRWASVFLTIFLFSFMDHINCGMYVCARYVLWIYPGIVFTVCDFIFKIFGDDRKKSFLMIVFCCVSYIFMDGINGGVYDQLAFNNTSRFILDHTPALYYSWCDSTFNTRASHLWHGGYDLDTIAIYADSETGDVRKIMIFNTEENREKLYNILESEQDPELLDVKQKLSKKTENKICYINYSRNSKIQYKTQYSVALYVWMDRFLDACGTNLDIDSYIELVQGVIDGDENTYKDLYNMLSFKAEDKDKFFHDAFIAVYENDVTDEWKPRNLNQYDNNYEIFKWMIQGDSFKSMVGL